LVVQGRHALPAVLPMNDTNASTLTITLAQLAAILGVVFTGVAGGAVWATKVTTQLAAIQSELTEIKSELRALRSADVLHDRRMDKFDYECCKRPASLLLWMPDRRRTIVVSPRPEIV